MSKKSISRKSQTDWDRIDRIRDKDIDLSDIPEITKDMMKKAVLRIEGKPVSMGKIRVNMLLDADVVAYFKERAGGRGYQTLINKTLKEDIKRVALEGLLRIIIREELTAKR